MGKGPQDTASGFVPGARALLAAGGLGLGTTLALGGSAQAAMFTVTNLNDSGGGSLREAITSANTNPGSTIQFSSGLSGTIHLASELPTIAHSMDIEGPGPGTLTVSGEGAHRIFYVNGGGGDQVTIANLALGNGQAGSLQNAGAVEAETGGGPPLSLTLSNDVFTNNSVTSNGATVFSEEDLTVLNCVFTNNNADSAGGLRQLQGSLTVRSSTISGNTATDVGGIEADDTAGAVTIDRTAVTGNTATQYDSGGVAIFRPHQPSVISTSTISGNHNPGTKVSFSGRGGGVNVGTYMADPLKIVGSTISGNTAAAQGGGLNVYTGAGYGPALLYDTIVASNSAPNGPDISGNAKAAFSLITNTSGAAVTETVPGSDIIGQDPQLGPLADNGGPTQTMALAPTSPAVDKGSAVGLTSDQRGVTRPIDFPSIPNSAAPGADGSDIGAFELQPSNAFTLGGLKRNRRKGTATQTVELPLPDDGSVTLGGRFLKTQTKQVADNGRIKLKVIPKRKLRKRLRRHHKAKAKEVVTYNPTGQAAKSITKRIKLLKR
jgi:hypothetical protein